MQNVLRALRLEFCLASLLPFVCGSFFAAGPCDGVLCVLGALTVLCAHLSANLINDYADSRSGVDWNDLHYYGLFGGSKLIQSGLLSERWYKNAAIFFASLAVLFITLISLMLGDRVVLGLAIGAGVLGWMYSLRPFALSHRALGEPLIFCLFGIVPFGAGFYLQTQIFFPPEILIASLPYGFLITAVLFANEIPDYVSDRAAGKRTWVSLCGPERAFLVYGLLQLGAFVALMFCISRRLYAPWVLISLVAIIPLIKALRIMRLFPYDKERLVLSSRITVAEYNCIGLILILGGVRL